MPARHDGDVALVRSSRRPRLRLAALAGLAGVAASAIGIVPARATAPSADLSVSATNSPSAPLAGTTVTFTLTAHNAGPDTASSVLLAMSTQFPLRVVSTGVPSNCTIGSGTSVVCKVGDVASGASASVHIVLTPLASGLFQVPAATSSETPDPTTADRSTTDTMIVQKGPSQAERYVPAIYRLLLGRTPGAPEAAYWVKVFNADRVNNTIYQVPLGLMSSFEYRQQRITEAYLRLLGRAPTAGDVAFWSGRIAQGLSYAGLETEMLVSKEFAQRAAGNPIDRVFAAVLHRPPSAAERNALQAEINGGASLADVVVQLFGSTEGYDRVINDRFVRTLGRGPAPIERYYWQSALRQGVSPEVEWAMLLAGFEYTNKFPPTYDDGCCYFFPTPSFTAA